MQDENFVRIMETVRAPFRLPEGKAKVLDGRRAGLFHAFGNKEDMNDAAGHSYGGRRLGTVLSLEKDALMDDLWTNLFNVLPMEAVTEARPAGAPAVAWQARNLEIFLSHIVSEVEHRHCRVLLNPKFFALLSPRSQMLRESLLQFLSSLPEDAKRSGAFQPVQALLAFMGLRTSSLRDLMGDKTVEGPYRAQLSRALKSS